MKAGLNPDLRVCGFEIRTNNQTDQRAAARIKKEHPGRFLFCADLPLPDVQKAIEEAKYALDVLKADGTRMKDYLLKEPDLAPSAR